MRFSLAVAAALLVSCSSHAEERPLESRAAIINGTTDDVDAFVVGIDVRAPSFVGSCTGTLLAPNLVLTARHCVSDVDATIDCTGTSRETPKIHANFDPSVFTVTTATNMYAGFSQVTLPSWKVLAVAYPDDAGCVDATFDEACQLCGYDLALLELAPNDPEAGAVYPGGPFPTPASVPPVVGAIPDVIGYGCEAIPDAATVCGSGVRSFASSVTVTAVGDLDIDADAPVCDGDSGSPLFDRSTGAVLAVASLSNATCTHAVFTRLDTQLEWLQKYATVAAEDGHYPPPAWVNGPPDAGPTFDGDIAAPPTIQDDACSYRPSQSINQAFLPWILAIAASLLRRRSRALA